MARVCLHSYGLWQKEFGKELIHGKGQINDLGREGGRNRFNMQYGFTGQSNNRGG